MEQSRFSRAQQPRFGTQPTPVMPTNEGASRPLGYFTLKDSGTNQMFTEAQNTPSNPQQQGLAGHSTQVMPTSGGASRKTRNFTLTSMDSTSDLNTPTLGTTANHTFDEATEYQYQPEPSEQLFLEMQSLQPVATTEPDKSASSQQQPL